MTTDDTSLSAPPVAERPMGADVHPAGSTQVEQPPPPGHTAGQVALPPGTYPGPPPPGAAAASGDLWQRFQQNAYRVTSKGPDLAGPHPADRLGDNRVEANARLTATTAVVLFVLLAVEGLTILRMGPLLRLHVIVGMVLIPVVALKVSSTVWRFAKYYRGDPAYRRRGPPPMALRLLGPFVIVLTVAVLASGVALLVGPTSLRSDLLLLHRASFIVWIAAMVVHVVSHLLDTARLAPRDFYARTRRQVRGAGFREWAVLASLAVGLALVPLVWSSVHAWSSGAHP